MKNETILAVTDLCQAYGSHQVLKNLSFTLGKGEIIGIIGENGAGKSTLVKCILGMLRLSSGKITCTTSVCAIHQEQNLVPSLPVYANFYLGRELTLRGGMLDIKKMARQAKEALSKLKVDIDPYALTESLSVSEKQMIEIARALDVNAGLLILDEPSALLNTEETSLLFQIMRELKAAGTSMIYISHKLEEIRDNCDSVAVLRDGELVGAGKASELTPREMAEMMVGRPLKDIYPTTKPHTNKVAVSYSSPAVGSFDIYEGEILGVAGLADSGQVPLGESLAGFHSDKELSIKIDGKTYKHLTPKKARALSIGYLTPDRLADGIWRDEAISKNIALGSIKRVIKNSVISSKAVSDMAEQYIDEFKIRCQSALDTTGSLSGGNQQKVSMAKVLADKPSVVVLNEPTQGVDVGARQEIYKTISKLSEGGVAILLISSDLTELIGMCRRIIVMRNGKIAGEVQGDDISENSLIRIATGTN